MSRIRMIRSAVMATLASAMFALLAVVNVLANEPGPPFPK
jgi:hypothetical protein